VFGARCGPESQPPPQIALHVDIRRHVVARRCHFVRRPETWKYLRPDGSPTFTLRIDWRAG
jgi:hypothetical protein